jgi:hypothetical protein
VISTASAQNVSWDIEYQLSVEASRDSAWTGGVRFHDEENFLSWSLALEYAHSFADDNATLSLAANQTLDRFDVYELGGDRVGRTSRSSGNLNGSISQLLSSTTVAALSYGVTLQTGELSNTWNSVPLDNGERVLEVLPDERLRHAAALNLVQWLPWNAALKASYRAYVDDWEVEAHTLDGRLLQRVAPWLVVGTTYRQHWQSGTSFFTTRGRSTARYLTADSDLGPLTAYTVGGNADFTLAAPGVGQLSLSLGYDRYFRSDDLTVDILTWACGLRF